MMHKYHSACGVLEIQCYYGVAKAVGSHLEHVGDIHSDEATEVSREWLVDSGFAQCENAYVQDCLAENGCHSSSAQGARAGAQETVVANCRTVHLVDMTEDGEATPVEMVLVG